MIKFVVDNVFTKVVGLTEENEVVRNALSYVVKDYQIIKRKKGLRHWDGRRSFYDGRSKVFLTGLLGRVIWFCKHVGLEYEIVDNRRRPEALVAPEIRDDMLHGITLYDYQERTVREFCKVGRGVVKLPTGAGKTEIAIAIAAALNVPMLWLTHRVNLLYQTAERFAKRWPEIKSKIGIIGDGNYRPQFLTFATVQTVHSFLKRYPEEMASSLQAFQLLVIDEAHRSGADQFNVPAQLCRNAYYRLGLTATPFMNGNGEQDFYLMGITGPIATKVTNAELIERGIMARPFFKFFDIEEPRDMKRLTDWREVYERGIIFNKARNGIIVAQAARLAAMDKKALCIVNEVKHGQLLCEAMLKAGISAAYQDGRNSYHERTRALKWLTRDGHCLIATNIFDEGIDVKDIGAVILAAGTKAAPALFQRTGRATRKKEEDNYAIIIDFMDRQHRLLYEHSKRRYDLISQEKGFTIL